MNSVRTVHRGCVFCSCTEMAKDASKRYARKRHKNVPGDKSNEKMNLEWNRNYKGAATDTSKR